MEQAVRNLCYHYLKIIEAQRGFVAHQLEVHAEIAHADVCPTEAVTLVEMQATDSLTVIVGIGIESFHVEHKLTVAIFVLHQLQRPSAIATVATFGGDGKIPQVAYPVLLVVHNASQSHHFLVVVNSPRRTAISLKSLSISLSSIFQYLHPYISKRMFSYQHFHSA